LGLLPEEAMAMDERLPVLRPCPVPVEAYLSGFDWLLVSRAQRQALRDYVVALLAPREPNKTLTALVDAKPGRAGSMHRETQRLQWFLSESRWDHAALTDQRIAMLVADPRTCPHPQQALVLDDSGDRKSGRATAYVARQYLGWWGKTEEGIVAVTTAWADERIYYPLHTLPYQPAGTLPGGKTDRQFATKGKLAARLVAKARAARAGPAATPAQAAATVGFTGRSRPGRWRRIRRRVRDGSIQTWWATELTPGRYGPTGARRLIVATSDPATRPAASCGCPKLGAQALSWGFADSSGLG
jgi:hypothetical protein